MKPELKDRLRKLVRSRLCYDHHRNRPVDEVDYSRKIPMGESVPVLSGCFSLTYVRNMVPPLGCFIRRPRLLEIRSSSSCLGRSRRHLVHVPYSAQEQPRTACFPQSDFWRGNRESDRPSPLRYVIDFLDFFWRTHHWPAFNVADSAIVVGVALSPNVARARQRNQGCS